jgi:phosphatidylglycerol:prolipoprotein diacylglycerol transferase
MLIHRYAHHTVMRVKGVFSMPTTPIQFPGFGFQVTVDRVAFSVFGIPIHWYGIIIAFGFLLAVLYGAKRAPKFGVKEDDLIDMLFFAVPSAIIVSRIYFVIFSDSIRSFAEAIRIWDGGLAIYGGVIGAVAAAVIFCRIRKVNTAALLDVSGLGLLIGQSVGRWGNFFNQEIYGTHTDLPWRMGVAAAGERVSGIYNTVHPLFLYESLWNALGFVLLHFVSKKRRFNGQIFMLYITWYGLGRAFFELIRAETDVLYLFNSAVPVSMALAVACAAAGAGLLAYNMFFRVHDPALLVNLTLCESTGGFTGDGEPENSEDAGTLPDELVVDDDFFELDDDKYEDVELDGIGEEPDAAEDENDGSSH